MNRKTGKLPGVKCPYCQKEIDDSYVRSHVASQLGKSRSPRKKQDKAKMQELGRKGAEKRWGRKKKQ